MSSLTRLQNSSPVSDGHLGGAVAAHDIGDEWSNLEEMV